MKTLLLLLMLALPCWAAELNTNFVAAIHRVETGGRVGKILGDNGKALGPLQIHKVCWQDAVEFDKSLSGAYSDCERLDYSIKIMTAYLNRYARKAIVSNDYETLARVWNGGPNGTAKSATITYWHKVRANMKL